MRTARNAKTGRKLYLGIDIGGTKIAGGLVDNKGTILARAKFMTPPNGTGAKILQRTKQLIGELLSSGTDGILCGIGIGIPGIVAPNQKDIALTPNIRLTKYPLAAHLEKAFGVKVVLGNDVNLGLLGESWLGVGKDVKNIIGLFPGTGVGGAIIIDGVLISGSQGAAGELGHMIMDMHSQEVNAGVYGSLEALASRRAIERGIKAGIKKGKKTIITRLQSKRAATIKSGILAEALRKKDPLTMSVFNEACNVIGKACISLRHILNPDMIILGGGITEACGEYILPRIRRISNGDPFFKGIDDCKIQQSVLGDDSIIYGAVTLLRQALGEKMSEKISIYPSLSLSRGAFVRVNNRLHEKSFYIRADGKVKAVKIKGTLDLDALDKICKKFPEVLILGSRSDQLKITQSMRSLLKEKKIALRRLKTKEAIEVYNATEKRKAIVFYQA